MQELGIGRFITRSDQDDDLLALIGIDLCSSGFAQSSAAAPRLWRSCQPYGGDQGAASRERRKSSTRGEPVDNPLMATAARPGGEALLALVGSRDREGVGAADAGASVDPIGARVAAPFAARPATGGRRGVSWQNWRRPLPIPEWATDAGARFLRMLSSCVNNSLPCISEAGSRCASLPL